MRHAGYSRDTDEAEFLESKHKRTSLAHNLPIDKPKLKIAYLLKVT